MTEQRCPVTGEVREQEEMLRLVLAPDGRVVVDLGGKLPGDAIFIASRAEVLENATAAIKTAFGENTTLPGQILDVVEMGLVKRIQNTVSLARKAGKVKSGFAKVEEALKAGKAHLLLEAADAGAADGDKLLHYAEKYGIEVASLLTREELGKPFGRDAVVHIVLQDARLTTEILKEIRRLAGFRNKDAL